MAGLNVIKDIDKMERLASEWRFDQNISLVPTMGYLHDGHLALVKEAAKRSSKVVVSIFVNPLQFGPNEDFNRYPRDTERDLELLKEAGADYVFIPDALEFTPPSINFTISPGEMGTVLCGKYRPGHFDGVCTIVMKLLQLISPGLAVFGWKDAQQFLILQKMVQDLNIPVRLHALDTIRESDGLAMSSRNIYLDSEQRKAAPAIYRALQDLQVMTKSGTTSARNLTTHFLQSLTPYPQLEVQYIQVVSQENLAPLELVIPEKTLIATAVYAGQTRLIDNIRL